MNTLERKRQIDICADETGECLLEHNEQEPGSDEVHHYGCECEWCMHVYWMLKN